MPQDGGCLLLPIAPGPEGSCTDLKKGGEGEERGRKGRGGGRREEDRGRRGGGRKKENEGRGRKEEGREKEEDGGEDVEEEGGETLRAQRYVLHRERCPQTLTCCKAVSLCQCISS